MLTASASDDESKTFRKRRREQFFFFQVGVVRGLRGWRCQRCKARARQGDGGASLASRSDPQGSHADSQTSGLCWAFSRRTPSARFPSASGLSRCRWCLWYTHRAETLSCALSSAHLSPCSTHIFASFNAESMRDPNWAEKTLKSLARTGSVPRRSPAARSVPHN